MTAIEQRNGKQIQEPDRDRQGPTEVDEINERAEESAALHSVLPDLTRNLGDSRRPAELISRLATHDQATDVGQSAVDDVPRALHAQSERGFVRKSRRRMGRHEFNRQSDSIHHRR